MREAGVQNSRRWNMFSDPRQMLFSLTFPFFFFLLYLSIPGPTVVLSWPEWGLQPAGGIYPDWGEGRGTNKNRLSLCSLPDGLALALALRNPVTQTD